ncbi:hypothetical protein EDB81DRAFT_351861 [Dactylonectria macrodidyma]|uniref:Uncharacterized protein n=1 Tax=Dactylonectria macrodidyma TaxID=307937 RepID=A0A9P9FHR4_9HYPO|nr:hypothetical protein EDB81DRAFT_351861 [Dactylonectria macrodidyma]
MQSTQSAPVGVGSEASRRPSGARATLGDHGQTDRIGIEEHNHQDNVSGHLSASVTVLSPDSPGHDGHRERGGSEIVEQISNVSISEEDGNVSSTESLSNSFSSDSVLSLGTVATSKKEAIVQYMIKLCRAWFDSRLVILARQCNEGEPGVQSGPTSSVSYTRGSGSTVRGSKRPRASEDEDGLDDERNEDEENDGRKESGVESESRKLACPFLKYNPGKYQAWRCCRWGWSTVHRVKLVQLKMALAYL